MFWKRAKKESTGTPSAVLRLLIGANRHLIRWAAWLGKRASACTPGQLKLFLALFCVSLAGLSSFVIISSFGKRQISFSVTPIRVAPLVEPHPDWPVITETEYQRFHKLRCYLDSLAQSKGGKPMLDSILQQHPHLPQTLFYLENLYHQQQKN